MRTFHSLPLLLGASLSQAFSLAGTVYRQGTVVPLAGATVTTTSHSELVSTTDAQGRFVLTNQASGIAVRRAPDWSANWESDGLNLRGLEQGTVEIDFLSPEGRHLEHLTAQTNSGNAAVRPSREVSRGLRIVRVRQGSRTRSWKLLAVSTSRAASLADLPAFAARGTETSPDTLVVAKPGMATSRTILPAGAGESVSTLTDPVTLTPLTARRSRFIPEGRVRMGDASLPESSPLVWRSVKAFWMDTALATQAEVRAMGFAQPYDDDRPAEMNWPKAARYCNARSLAEGLTPAYTLSADSAFWIARTDVDGYRLPTEAEWEYAIRAGTTTPWYWGDDTTLATIGQYAMYSGNTRGNPAPVASFKPNGFGLYDMAGNSWEWTDDMFGPYVADETKTVPQMMPYGYHRVFRGGAWFAKIDSLRSGFRGHESILKSDYVGVRCVRTAFPDTTPPAWRRLAVFKGQRRIPGGSVRMGDSLQPEAQPFNTRVVGDLWVDTGLVMASEFVATSGIPAYVDSVRPIDAMWYKAVRYCNARSAKEGMASVYDLSGDSTIWAADTSKDGYRLPSEAEWEYLARAGSNSGWWWGDDTAADVVASRAWWGGNTMGNPQPIGQKLPNAFGLYDMAGNSKEWTEDLYGPYKADGSQPVPQMQTYGYHRVYRGGAWFSPLNVLRSGWREHDLGLASGYIAFRCVRKAR
jgi:formylglycine-generating enzyme required for sulfatase activity